MHAKINTIAVTNNMQGKKTTPKTVHMSMSLGYIKELLRMDVEVSDKFLIDSIHIIVIAGVDIASFSTVTRKCVCMRT